MTIKHQTFIAGERLDDLVTAMRKMPVTDIVGTRAQISFSFEDPSYVSWARAAERWAADLLTAGGELTRNQRVQLAAQRVADEVAKALDRNRR